MSPRRVVALRQRVQRLYARAVNDKRPHPEYSWGWLNRQVEDLFWENPGAEIRPQYAWGAMFAAAQARALGLSEVSLVEFGVAGGRGLLALEGIAAAISRTTGVRLSVYGFDMGSGLPPVTDVRDLPQLYKASDFRMDFGALQSRLQPATKLLLGNVNETIDGFLSEPHPPVGFVSFDMDLYTSTHASLKLFRGDMPFTKCLPRVVCYMDDIMGLTFSDVTGERLAMNEYNEREAPWRCISPVYGLRYYLGWPHSRALWPDMMFWAHFLDHPQYGVHDGLSSGAQAPMEGGR